jgi:hypothetical protein
VLANERFRGRNHKRHLCRECARLPQEERDLASAELELWKIHFRNGKFRRKRPQIARFLRHHHPWVQLLAEAMLRPPMWLEEQAEFEEEIDRRELVALGYFHGDRLAVDDVRAPDLEEWEGFPEPIETDS